jgi:hypothetical protein
MHEHAVSSFGCWCFFMSAPVSSPIIILLPLPLLKLHVYHSKYNLAFGFIRFSFIFKIPIFISNVAPAAAAESQQQQRVL